MRMARMSEGWNSHMDVLADALKENDMNDMNELPTPQINHTTALEDAAIAVSRATNGCGLPVFLCDALYPQSVERALKEIGGWFADPDVRFIDCQDSPDNKSGNTRLAAIENLILLATLYREHIKAGNLGVAT